MLWYFWSGQYNIGLNYCSFNLFYNAGSLEHKSIMVDSKSTTFTLHGLIDLERTVQLHLMSCKECVFVSYVILSIDCTAL